MSLGEINQSIVQVLDNFSMHVVEMEGSEFEENEEKKQKIFTIEVSDRKYSALKETIYNKHQHLYVLLKTFNKSVEKIKPILENIANSIKNRYPPLQCIVRHKIDSNNM